jgi:hypothetical protein
MLSLSRKIETGGGNNRHTVITVNHRTEGIASKRLACSDGLDDGSPAMTVVTVWMTVVTVTFPDRHPFGP